MQVFILNVDTSDIGEYPLQRKKAQNEVGSDTCICIVKLKGKPYFLHMAEMAGTCKMVICLLFSLSGQIFPTISIHLSLFRTTKICLQLNSLTVVAGEPAELQASIEGTQPISVQWLREGRSG